MRYQPMQPTSKKVLAEWDRMDERAETLSESLDDFIREEEHGVKLIALSRLLVLLGGHRICDDEHDCPMADRRLVAALQMIRFVLMAQGISREQGYFVFASLVGGFPLGEIMERFEEEEEDA